MATRVNTDPQTDIIEMNDDILQQTFAKGQCPVNMNTKLNVTFKEETIVSAMLKFTEMEEKKTNNDLVLYVIFLVLDMRGSCQKQSFFIGSMNLSTNLYASL